MEQSHTESQLTRIAKILIAQPAPPAGYSPFQRLQDGLGVELTFRPFIKVEGVSGFEFRKQRVDIGRFGGVVFVSKKAIDHFFRICNETRYQVPDAMRYYCLKDGLGLYLQKYIVYRKRKVTEIPSGSLEELVAQLQKSPDDRYLLPLSNVHKNDIVKTVRAAGLRITKSVMFNTVSADLHDIAPDRFDMLVLYTPLDVSAFAENFPDFPQGALRIAAFGKATQRAVKHLGYQMALQVPTPQYKSMTEALEAYVTQANQ